MRVQLWDICTQISPPPPQSEADLTFVGEDRALKFLAPPKLYGQGLRPPRCLLGPQKIVCPNKMCKN